MAGFDVAVARPENAAFAKDAGSGGAIAKPAATTKSKLATARNKRMTSVRVEVPLGLV